MKSGERHDVIDRERIAIGKTQVFLYSQPSNRMKWLKADEIELVYEPRRR